MCLYGTFSEGYSEERRDDAVLNRPSDVCLMLKLQMKPRTSGDSSGSVVSSPEHSADGHLWQQQEGLTCCCHPSTTGGVNMDHITRWAWRTGQWLTDSPTAFVRNIKWSLENELDPDVRWWQKPTEVRLFPWRWSDTQQIWNHCLLGERSRSIWNIKLSQWHRWEKNMNLIDLLSNHNTVKWTLLSRTKFTFGVMDTDDWSSAPDWCTYMMPFTAYSVFNCSYLSKNCSLCCHCVCSRPTAWNYFWLRVHPSSVVISTCIPKWRWH